MSWMQTYTGEQFWFEHLVGNEIVIEDIAHALSNICRFGGHTREFYSVLDHSLLVTRYLERAGASSYVQMLGLLHDAHEAYTGDIPTPFKRYLWFQEDHMTTYMERVQERIMNALLPQPEFLQIGNDAERRAVARADTALLLAEARDLLPRGPVAGWTDEITRVTGVQAYPGPVQPSAPREAREAFLRAYRELRDKVRA